MALATGPGAGQYVLYQHKNFDAEVNAQGREDKTRVRVTYTFDGNSVTAAAEVIEPRSPSKHYPGQPLYNGFGLHRDVSAGHRAGRYRILVE